MAFAEIEPFGDEEHQSYWRSGMIASTIANANRDSKKQRQPFKPEDFMPSYESTPETEPDPEQQSRRMLAIVERWNAALGGADNRANRRAN